MSFQRKVENKIVKVANKVIEKLPDLTGIFIREHHHVLAKDDDEGYYYCIKCNEKVEVK